MRVRAAVLGHCRAPLDGAARPRGPHAAPASGARQRRRLPPLCARARCRAVACAPPSLTRVQPPVERSEKGREQMKLGFVARPAERHFSAARARRNPTARASWAGMGRRAKQAGAGAPLSRPRPRLSGLEPGREAVRPKRARPESAQLGKGVLSQISLILFLKNYEINIGLHSDGPNELLG